MHINFLTIAKLSFQRYLYLIKETRNISLTRALMYENLRKIQFDGALLDFGGGEGAKYKQLLKCEHYRSANIDKTIDPTWVIGVGDTVPCGEHVFDNVISINTIEHIYNPDYIFFEFYRVLKPRGKLLISTPFLYPIHSHPDDFFRPTPSWYRVSLEKAGFKKIIIDPLAWGPFTTAATTSGLPGPFSRMRFIFALSLDLVYRFLKVDFTVRNNAYLTRNALGFIVKAEK